MSTSTPNPMRAEGDRPEEKKPIPELIAIRDAVSIELVRLAAESKRNDNQRSLWKFVNSGFGLLILSGVVLSSGATLFSWVKTKMEKAEAIQERLDRIDAEITMRFRRALPVILKRALPPPEGFQNIKNVSPMEIRRAEYVQISDILKGPSTDQIYQREFREYNVLSLLAEALATTENPDVKKAIRRSIEHLELADQLSFELYELSHGRFPKNPRVEFGIWNDDGTERGFLSMRPNAGSEQAARRLVLAEQLTATVSLMGNQGMSHERELLECLYYWRSRNTVAIGQASKEGLETLAEEFGVGGYVALSKPTEASHGK